MFSTFKEKFSKKLVPFLTVLTILVLPVIAKAEETPVDITGPLQTALNTTITNTIACFSAIIPIGLTIFGAKFAWTKGVQFFSRIASK